MNREVGLLPGLAQKFSRARGLFAPVSVLVRARGWPFILSWCHRLSGIILFLFLMAHLWTLSSLANPASYDAKMRIFGFFLLAFLEWVLALPVVFHALNGGRLILYEGFGVRDDRVMIRWVACLSIAYMAILGWAMLRGDQSVSPALFWLGALVLATFAASGAAARFWREPQRPGWRLQRISGAFLMVLIPAHMFFMHLSFSVGHDSSVVLQRLQSSFIRGVDLLLLATVLYHGGYGAFSIAGDYLPSKTARGAVGVALTVLVLLLGWVGFRVLLGGKGGSIG
jgi:succinate dehydrogenase cytochrome b556 subunit